MWRIAFFWIPDQVRNDSFRTRTLTIKRSPLVGDLLRAEMRKPFASYRLLEAPGSAIAHMLREKRAKKSRKKRGEKR